MKPGATRKRIMSCFAQIINGYVLGYKIPELVKHERTRVRKLSKCLLLWCGSAKMKKENTIQLVGELVLAYMVVGVFVTGAYLEWPGFYKHADCHCCDDIW